MENTGVKPMTNEAIAMTEKKMDMTLDDIIKMTKTTELKRARQRISIKRRPLINGLTQAKSTKLRQFVESRSSIRQGVLSQRRTNFKENQFPVTTEVARKAAAGPIPNRMFNSRPRAANWNKKIRVGMRLGRNFTDGGFVVKQGNAGPAMRQRTRTLDSLFADMKEQRLKTISNRNNVKRRGNGGGQQRRSQWLGKGPRRFREH